MWKVGVAYFVANSGSWIMKDIMYHAIVKLDFPKKYENNFTFTNMVCFAGMVINYQFHRVNRIKESIMH